MKRLLLVSSLLILALVFAQDAEEVVCDTSPEQFEGVEATGQGIVDQWIQRLQGGMAGAIIKRIIGRNLRNPNSVIRKMLGRLLQDPADPDFEEGDVGVAEPMYAPLADLITKIYGETKTVVGYLRAFGFFAKVMNLSPNDMENYKGQIPPCAITDAVKEFQLFNHLEPTGTLTKETRELMAKERCGNPDVKCETPECLAKEAEQDQTDVLHRRRRDTLKRQKRYEVIEGRRWRESDYDFTYFYQGYTDDLTREVQRSEIERALKEWSEVAKVSFTEVFTEEEASIRIDFGGGDHGDKYPFSGPGGVLAHGFYPRKGDMHFDDDEQYTANQYSGTNLYYVATHEFGHVLGIRHSDVRGSVMLPYYPGFKKEIVLAQDDIDAAVELFGAREQSADDTEDEDPAVDGNWSEFGAWSECSAECGGGVQSRSKTCTNPAPANGGAECEGPSTETRGCNFHACAVPEDGNWSDFGPWSDCTAECDGGTQIRIKTCTNPAPSNGGRYCEGDAMERRVCNTQECVVAVDGNWSEFGPWSECSAECEGGLQTRIKTCTNPQPSNGGKFCEGVGMEQRACNTQECVVVVDGNWSEFGAWSECSAECGGGVQSRSKTCTNPAPANGGAECEGNGVERRACNTQDCPVHGNWSPWSDWSRCSVYCGGGRQSRARTCTNPPPSNGGDECEGDNSSETRSCNEQDCWSEWSEWSECTSECGGGVMTKARTCTNPENGRVGEQCGVETRNQACNMEPCPTEPRSAGKLIPTSGVSQSSTAKGDRDAEYAVDGDVETKSATRCTGSSPAWFKYKMSGKNKIGVVEIVNGNFDNKMMKLDKAKVYAMDKKKKHLCGVIDVDQNSGNEQGQTYTVDCRGAKATSIKIVQDKKWNKRKCLELKEVRVYEQIN